MSARCFFVPDSPDGKEFVPTDWARGPWGATISGNYVGGLLGHVIERDAGDPELQPARLTVDRARGDLLLRLGELGLHLLGLLEEGVHVGSGLHGGSFRLVPFWAGAAPVGRNPG